MPRVKNTKNDIKYIWMDLNNYDKEIIKELEYQEKYWQDENIINLKQDEREQYKKEINSFIGDRINEFHELQEQLKEWKLSVEQRVRYIENLEGVYKEYGENIVFLMEYLNSWYDNTFIPLLAPPGYWRSNGNNKGLNDNFVVEIEKLATNHLQECIYWVEDLNKDLEKDIKNANRKWKGYFGIIKIEVIPIVKSKLQELKTEMAKR